MKKLVENMEKRKTQRAIVPGKIARTDGFDVDGMISELETQINNLRKMQKKELD